MTHSESTAGQRANESRLYSGYIYWKLQLNIIVPRSFCFLPWIVVVTVKTGLKNSARVHITVILLCLLIISMLSFAISVSVTLYEVKSSSEENDWKKKTNPVLKEPYFLNQPVYRDGAIALVFFHLRTYRNRVRENGGVVE